MCEVFTRTQQILCEVFYRKDRADAAGGGFAGYCLEDTKPGQGAEQLIVQGATPNSSPIVLAYSKSLKVQ